MRNDKEDEKRRHDEGIDEKGKVDSAGLEDQLRLSRAEGEGFLHTDRRRHDS
jgi:hypothetical protein